MDANSPLTGVLAFVAVQAVIWSVFGLLWYRRERRWQREDLLRRQLWEMERQIREEGMSEEWRQWHREYRQREAEIKAEARRRLGLPEEADEP
jgi:hypothetical protein